MQETPVEKPSQEAKFDLKKMAKRFLILFLLLIVAFYALWKLWLQNSGFAEGILTAYAASASWVISLFGTAVTTDGHIMKSDVFSMNVATGCDGIEPMAYYLCAVTAFPVAIKYKWKAFLYGIVILAGLNLIRVITLYYIGIHWHSVFEFFHVGVWQVGMIAAGGLIWLYWILNTFKMMQKEST